jgi:hypothetical protein
MKKILVIIAFSTSPFLITACDKTEFKETKIAPQPTQMMAQTTTPDLANKELPPGHPPVDGKAAPASGASSTTSVEKISKAQGGITVAECFEKNPKLKNAKVTIHGKIVKYNSGIMGKNWIHLRDGSGVEGKNDLVVTTEQVAKVNDVVTVTGSLQYDRDIGSGYFFPAIIENANIKAE